MIVLDTNVLSELIRPRPAPEVVAWLDRWDSAELATTSVTAAELRAGVATMPTGRRGTMLGKVIERVLEDSFRDAVLPFDLFSSIRYAEVTATRRRRGSPIAVLDAQIAAVCLQHEAVLATRNTMDFEGLGIELVNPWNA